MSAPNFRGYNNLPVFSSQREHLIVNDSDRQTGDIESVVVMDMSESGIPRHRRSTRDSTPALGARRYTRVNRNGQEDVSSLPSILDTQEVVFQQDIYPAVEETVGDFVYKCVCDLNARIVGHTETETQPQSSENEKVPSSISVLAPVPRMELQPSGPRLLIHIRYLLGDEHIRVTKQVIDFLREPFNLTDDEVLRLYEIQDTKQLAAFLHDTHRIYTIKVHNTVHFKEEVKDFTHDGVERIKSHISHQDDDASTFSEKKRQSTPHDEELPEGVDRAHTLEISPNVLLEIRFPSPPKISEAKGLEHHRRKFFDLPDPDLSDEIGHESSATWIELLGDVFYVGWLSAFTHQNHISDSQSLGRYAAWFVVMWWTWCSSALYAARYDTADVMHHVYKIIELCGLISMAAASNDFWTSPKRFIIGYMTMKAILLVQYSVILWGAVISGTTSKKPLSAYVFANAVSLTLWGISLHYQSAGDVVQRTILWYIAILTEVVVNFLLRKNARVSLAASHMAERFGLFTLIILGENCMGFISMVSQSTANSSMSTEVTLANMMGVVVIVGFFFMYFDDFSKEVLSNIELSQAWIYLHFPLHLCQVAFGISLTDAITILDNGWENISNSCTAAAESAASNQAAETFANSLVTESASEAAECIAPQYVYQTFWVTAGLILCINALIKIINTPLSGLKWSGTICCARVLNAIAFFGLSAGSYQNFNGPLGMIGVLMACLIVQAGIDLID